jgi:hypothetical protein
MPVSASQAAGRERQRQNAAVLGQAALTAAQMEVVDALDRDHHFCSYPWNYGESLHDNRLA